MKIHTSQHDWFGFSLPCWFHAIHSLTVSATSFHCFVLLAFLFSCPKCPMTESSSANTNSSLSFWSFGSPCFTSIFPARCSLSATPFCSDLNSISSPQNFLFSCLSFPKFWLSLCLESSLRSQCENPEDDHIWCINLSMNIHPVGRCFLCVPRCFWEQTAQWCHKDWNTC